MVFLVWELQSMAKETLSATISLVYSTLSCNDRTSECCSASTTVCAQCLRHGLQLLNEKRPLFFGYPRGAHFA